jgi:hypothetical protein
MSNHEIRMNDQLWQMSRKQAQEVLDTFLVTQREVFPSLTIGSVDLDYSAESVIEAAHYIANQSKAGLLDEEQQKIWFARLGYYFGEALIRAKPQLSWGLGDPEFAFANHPVILGFADGEEGPMITICSNVILAVAYDGVPTFRIDNAVSLWFDKP